MSEPREMTADEFRAVRQRLGLTQVLLAELLDITASSISNYEGAHGPYPIPRVIEFAMEWLLEQHDGAQVRERPGAAGSRPKPGSTLPR
jgi:transcriptional regulator with XRE-family HTH domain